MQLITLYYRFILMVENLHKTHAYSACFSGSCINDLDFYPWYIMHILHVFEGDIPEYICPEMTFLVQKVKSYILGIENIYIVLIYV